MINNPQNILIIQSEISELKKVELFVKEIIQKYDIHKRCFNKIYLCVSEAVINSIKHGNKSDKKKNVIIEASCKRNILELKIEDEGEGFDVNEVKNPTKNSNLKNESGRGIFIIRNMSNKLEYNEKGNRIQFKIECK